MIVQPSAAATTVFCAVWNRDPQRHELLRGHQACLEAQTEPVSPIYVFDDGDTPPAWVRGTVAVSRDALTIYQAWNVATQLATTQFVMNLNLDDRLAPEAVSLLQFGAFANEAGLVCGDWNVTFSQQQTDAVASAHAATTLPFLPGWPPAAGQPTRLGSGTGHRGTLGPATLWRRAFHDVAPFPWQLESGDLIRIVGDAVWWRIVVGHFKASVVKLPVVVGNYFSHPNDQAEFRSDDEHSFFERPVALAQFPLNGIEVHQSAT